LAHVLVEASAESGNKRKLDQQSSTAELVVYQFFRQEHGLSLVRLKVSVSTPSHSPNQSSWVTGSRQSALLSIRLVDERELAIAEISILGLVEDNNAVTVFYKLTDGLCFYATVSLRMGQVIGSPVALPFVKQVGLLGTVMLAVLTDNNEVLLFDTVRGARIGRHLLEGVSSSCGSCQLVTDMKRSRLAVFFVSDDGVDDNKYSIAYSSVQADIVKGQSLRGPRLSLAAGLASASGGSPLFGPTRTLVFDGDVSDDGGESQMQAINRGLQFLDEACTKCGDGVKEASEPLFLLNAYEFASKMAQGECSLTTIDEDNPQDAIKSKNGKKINGVHSASPKKVKSQDVEQVSIREQSTNTPDIGQHLKRRF
jgi:hypothetical protein